MVGFYVFSHRSFQEYFTAVFINACRHDLAVDMLKRIADRVDRDNVLSLLLELNPELVERNWVLPRLRRIMGKIEAFPTSELEMEFTRAFLDIAIDRESQSMFFGFKGRMGHSLSIIADLYSIPANNLVSSRALEDIVRRADASMRPLRVSGGIVYRYGMDLSAMKGMPSNVLLPTIVKLRRFCDRIETSHQRKRLKLEALLTKSRI